MTLTIRAETPQDYPYIAEVNTLAFGPYRENPAETSFVGEGLITALMRETPQFDPELSLVAEEHGQRVGHALFYPYTVRVDGQHLRAVCLGPIAVHPDHQKSGVGAHLVREGHRRAAEKGFAYSFLLGHDTYYPRFGYRTHMFGTCRLEVKTTAIPAVEGDLHPRLVTPADLPLLLAMWEHWFHDVDLAMEPGLSLLDWHSRSPEITAYAAFQDSELIGYLRYAKANPAEPNLFLARGRQAALLLLAHLKKRLPAETPAIHLPLHPSSNAVRENFPVPYQAHLQPWSAGMICILDPACQPIQAYCAEVAAGTRPAGLVSFPPSIEFA